jgi:hypothetical protein
MASPSAALPVLVGVADCGGRGFQKASSRRASATSRASRKSRQGLSLADQVALPWDYGPLW